MAKDMIKLDQMEKTKLVEDIVEKWNILIENVQNLTIQLCLYIKEQMKEYDSASITEVMNEVKKHPKIKRFVSIDRIWQGMRLIERRPDVIQYMISPEDVKETVEDEKKPILKKDGDVFIEAYFELEKSPLPPLERDMLEIDAKENNWSYRELKNAIKQRIEEKKNPGKDWYKLQQARENYISEIIAIVKSMPTEKLPNIISLLESYRKQNESNL